MIPMELPSIYLGWLNSCTSCAHSRDYPGDFSVGMGPYWECALEEENEALRELIEFVLHADVDEFYLAERCGHYEMAWLECGCCGAKLPGEAELCYWSSAGSYDCVPQPYCSETCAEIDMIVEMRIVEETLKYWTGQ